MIEWPSEIVKGVLIQQRLRELDRKELYKYFLPEVAAGEDEIAATEQALGYRLDPAYRQFLRYANGWRSFFQDIDILGTRELAGGRVMHAARSQLDAIEPEIFADDIGLDIADVLPIAASTLQSDMFLLGLPRSKEPGIVVWVAGYQIERYPNFDEFYLSMLDYNRWRIAKFEESAR